MDRVIRIERERVSGTVVLPASKSVSNRALILNALSGGSIVVENVSDCDDTRVLLRALSGGEEVVDVGHAGTAMRFLTAYFVLRGERRVLTGSGRMLERPIRGLVDALRELGAGIEYVGNEGFPPLRLLPCALMRGKEIRMDASVSSQYVSALMMIAPLVKGGVSIRLEGGVVSGSYIRMTAGMMRRYGVEVRMEGVRVVIPEGRFCPLAFRVEADWSAASYFYELLAVTGAGEVYLPGLEVDSWQGDACQCGLWERLGVRTVECLGGVMLLAQAGVCDFFEADFTEMPDVALSFAVACCLRDVPFRLRGLETLSVKECDRVEAVCCELSKLGYLVDVPAPGELCWSRERDTLISMEVDTYEDHRMAMAFAAAGYRFPGLIVRNMEVVSKSFPGFWEQFDGLVMC